MSVEQFFSLDRPLHPLPEPGRMRSANLWGLDHLVERLGGDTLGYAERTSFGRAFKRWCGRSPQAYRRH